MINHVGVDKSATGSLLICKINTVVSTFNIRSLNSIEKIGELTALAEEKGISVVCLQEHRKFHDSAHVHYTVVGKGRILANSSCWKKSMNSCVEGVGMLLSLSAHNSLEGNIVVVNSQIIVANFSGNPATTIREFKIRRLRTTATDKHDIAHDQNHVTVHFSRVTLRLR